ncbi:MAG: P-II family nitrogen regulator [Pirellula sp.]|jgi:nitrogen regulatory protein P-II 1|nr:P-II family nitrogen regulator [Pirellula sp.]
MKIVIAVVRPYVAESLLQNLRLAPLEALQVAEVKGFGRQKSYLDQYSSTEYSLAFLPKIEITMFVDDMRVEEVLRVVVETSRSGRMGDGKVIVLNADDRTPT